MAYTDELRDTGCSVVEDNNTILRIRESLHRDATIHYDEYTQNWVVEIKSIGWPGHGDELFRAGTSRHAPIVMERIRDAIQYIKERRHPNGY